MSAINHKVLGKDGKEAGSVELDAEIFDCKVSRSLVHDTVVWQLAKRRAGTHSAMTKAEVSGGGKKPWKQKGTGQARAGSNTSPLWVGGGVVHGPKPRDYTTRLPKRQRRQALCSVLTYKRKKDGLMVIEDLNVKSGKTKDMVSVLKKLGILGEKIAFLVPQTDASVAVERASRNIAGLKTIKAQGINVYDILKYKYLLATKESIVELQAKIKA